MDISSYIALKCTYNSLLNSLLWAHICSVSVFTEKLVYDPSCLMLVEWFITGSSFISTNLPSTNNGKWWVVI
jgi:hypothetical protein